MCNKVKEAYWYWIDFDWVVVNFWLERVDIWDITIDFSEWIVKKWNDVYVASSVSLQGGMDYEYVLVWPIEEKDLNDPLLKDHKSEIELWLKSRYYEFTKR